MEQVGFIHKQRGTEVKLTITGPTLKKLDCRLFYNRSIQYTWHITQPKVLWTSTEKLSSYLSASTALFTHKPKGTRISKDYCSKADFSLASSLNTLTTSLVFF